MTITLVASRLKEIREKQGLTQRELSLKIDALGEHLDHLKDTLQREQYQHAGTADLVSRKIMALEEIRALTVAGLMGNATTDKARFNQLLAGVISHISITSIDLQGVHIHV